jgi:CRP-like cAMP-binding protein
MVEPDQLSGLAIVAGMPSETLAAIARNATIRSFETGDVLFEEGDMATELYGLLEGEVELSIVFQDRQLKTEVRHEDYVHKRVEIIEKEMVFETVEPGEIFAWSALVAPHQLTSTARCTEPVRLIALPVEALEAVFERTPRVGAVFMKRLAEVIAQRLQHRTDKLIESWYQAFGEERL